MTWTKPTINVPPPRAQLEVYTMDVMRDDWGTLLAPFVPPLPREAGVILASYFGDVFVKGPEGEIWWLNGLEARVDRIAASQEAFEQRLLTEYFLMLKTMLLEELVDAKKVLAPGRLYGLKVPRSEGGQYTADNIGTSPIADAFNYMGYLFHQKRAAAGEQSAQPQPATAGLEQPMQDAQPDTPPEPPAGTAGDKPKKKGWFS